MDKEEWGYFLVKWQRWYFHDHSIRGLGIAQSAYAERIGTSYSTSDPADDVDPDLARWHDFFRRELPSEVREAIRVEYLVAGKKSEKHKDVGVSSRDYGPRLQFAIETARQMFTRAQEMRRNAAQESAHESA